MSFIVTINRMFYYLILLVIVGRTTISYYIDCSQDDGSMLHVLPYSGCQQYYSCKSGVVKYYQCPPGTIFNYHLNKCSTSGSCYELVCAGRRDGIYADTTENCTRYYNCIGGLIRSLHSCPSGTAFSDNHCRPALRAKCEPLEAALSYHQRDLCENHLDGYHALADCSAYVLCSGGVEKQIFVCPPGLIFNGTHCTKNVNCASSCTHKPDGYYYDIDTGCSEYLHCNNGVISKRFKCPSGTIFNGENCVIETSFQCPQINKCKGIANGLYSDYGLSCKSYYQCENGQTNEKMTCSKEQVWNGKKCVPETQFHCEDPVFSIDCLGKLGFFVNKLNCSNYFYCNFGMKTSFACPDKLIFNGSTCVESNKYLCPNFTENSCEGKQEGFYMDTESNCQSYYYCAKGNKLIYVCPFEQLYNGEECVSKSSYTCPFSSTDCQNISNGYHKSNNSHSEYLYCLNGVKLSTFKCNLNEIFDGEKCTINEDSNNICKDTKKGYISSSDCKTYYLCKEYTILETNTCPNKYLFNGKECVPTEQYKCPNNECTNSADGFFQDLESDCHKYYFCINGYKTTLTCPAGKVHNGNLCVPRETYTCKSKLPSNDNIIYVT